MTDVFNDLDSDDESLSAWTAEFSEASTPRNAFFNPTDEELKAVAELASTAGAGFEVADPAGEEEHPVTPRLARNAHRHCTPRR